MFVLLDQSDRKANNIRSGRYDNRLNNPRKKFKTQKKLNSPKTKTENLAIKCKSLDREMPTPRANINFPMTSLYVGDLHPDVTEALLYEKFSPAGQILSLRVCRDSRTKLSLGYAYINFCNSLDAERVLDTMNFDLLKGKPIRLMWSQRDPSLRRTGVGNVFIKNLDKSIDNKAMYDTFSAFGTILSCKVASDEDDNSKGYGFVHFESLESANKAIEKVNGMLLNGKKVFVGKFMSKWERDRANGEKIKKFTNVYVKNFPKNVTDEQLYDLFKRFGTITSCIIMRNVDGTSKGFGFIAYDQSFAAERAVREMNEYEIEDAKIYVGRAQKKSERQRELRKSYEQMKLERYNRVQGANLYIKNLDDTFDNDRLRKEFTKFGTITSAKVMTENGRSKGFGFVCFSSPEEASKAITEMDGRMVGSKPIYVALAQRYEERRAYLSAQCMQRIRHQTVSPPLAPPQFLIPALPQPRFYNHVAQLRPSPRWAGLPRLNGTFGLLQPAFRGPPRPRPITAQQQQQQQRPNSKYTAGRGRNGGDGFMYEEDKRLLGDVMYGVIEKAYPELAGKITGMLLEIETGKLKKIVDCEGTLKAKIEEAVKVLREHEGGLAVQD